MKAEIIWKARKHLNGHDKISTDLLSCDLWKEVLMFEIVLCQHITTEGTLMVSALDSQDIN